MTESYQRRCGQCGDQADQELNGIWYCERHRARQSAGESTLEAIARLQREAMAAIPEGDAEAQRRERECDAFKQKLWRERVLEITRSWVAKNAFAPALDTQALLGVRKWLGDGCQHALVLRGGVGTGKTSAACFAVRHWSEPKVYWDEGRAEPREDPASSAPRVTWLRPDQLVSAVMHDYDERSPRLHRYVVIDDLGRETRAEFVECLCELFDRDGHVVLVTTNMTKEQMRERYKREPRLMDRLRDRARPLDIGHDTLRRKTGDF